MVIKKLRQMKNQISISSTGWLQYIVERLAAKELDILMSCLVGWDQNRVKRMNDNLKWMLMLYLLYLWTDNCLLTCLLLKLYEARICQRCVYSCWKQSGGVYSLQMTWTSGGTSWLIWCHTRRAALLKRGGCRGGSCGLRAFTTFGALWPAWHTSGRTGGLDTDVCTLESIQTECHQIHMTLRWKKKTKTSGFDTMPTLKKKQKT